MVEGAVRKDAPLTASYASCMVHWSFPIDLWQASCMPSWWYVESFASSCLHGPLRIMKWTRSTHAHVAKADAWILLAINQVRTALISSPHGDRCYQPAVLSLWCLSVAAKIGSSGHHKSVAITICDFLIKENICDFEVYRPSEEFYRRWKRSFF